MKYLLIFNFALLFAVSGYSQKEPIKYGRLEENEINLTEYDQAPAVILCDYGRYYFDGRLGRVYFYFSRHVRIKILTEDGLKYATQTFSFYDLTKATYYQYSNGYELRGQTLNVDSNGKIIKSKLKGKNIGKNNTSDDYITGISFHFPDVKVGSIIEFDIDIPTIEIVNPPIWYMQYEIPVLHNELRITSPEEVNYSARAYNCDILEIAENKAEGSVISYPRGSLSYPANKLRFVKTNIPAYSTENNSENSENGRMYLKFMLDRATRKFIVPGMEELFKAVDPSFKYLDKAEKSNMLRNSGYVLYNRPELKEVAFDLMKDPGFGVPLILNLGLNDTLKVITANARNTAEKAMLIYDFVSQQMDWDSTYRVFVKSGFSLKMAEFISRISSADLQLNKSLSKPFKKHIGSGSEINFILINLLNTAGIKAYPVLISTQDYDLIDTAFFNLHQFNHVVASVTIQGKKYMLDAVRKGDGTILSKDALNPYGLLIEKDNAYWITIGDN